LVGPPAWIGPFDRFPDGLAGWPVGEKPGDCVGWPCHQAPR
jgi:hypothetical protein